MLFLANSLVTAFILYYSVRLLLAHFSSQPVEHPYKFFIKTILVMILMNYSLSICTYLINCTSTISTFFCELGHEIFGKKISFITLTNELRKSFDSSFNVFSLNGILASTLYLSSFSLALNFALRYILTKVLIILSPFAFLCLMNQSTEPLFKSWCKAFLSLLFLQIVVSIILLLPFAIMKENSNSLFNELLMIGAITALLKSNHFVRELIGGLGITANFQSGLSRNSKSISKLIEVSMKKYVFPFNYDRSNRIMGIIEYKLIFPITLYGGFLLLILSLFSFSFFAKIGIFTILFFPIFLLLNTSIYGEPFYIFAFFVIKHHFSQHKYLLSNKIDKTKTP